jgi:hypothetical protein
VSYPVALLPVARIVDYLHATYMPRGGLGHETKPVTTFLELAKADYEPVSGSSSRGGAEEEAGEEGPGSDADGENGANNYGSMHFVIRILLVAVTSGLSLLSSNFATVGNTTVCFLTLNR